MKIGHLIRKHRQEKGYSQEYLGKKIGLSQNSIFKIESDIKIPTIEELEKINNILEIDIQSMLNNDSNNKKNVTYNIFIITEKNDLQEILKNHFNPNSEP